MLYLWIAIVTLLTIIELLTLNLTNIWFVISGLVALVVSLYSNNYIIQFITFALLGLILLIVTKPLVRRIMIRRYNKLNVIDLIDTEGVVIKEIKKNNYGEVLVDGKSLIAYADKKIAVDEIVKIVKVDTNKVKVIDI